MNRRFFLAAAALACAPAIAQPLAKPKRVFVFLQEDPNPSDWDARELAKSRYSVWAHHGFAEKRDVVETFVFLGSDRAQWEAKARAAIAARPDLILTYGPMVTHLAKRLTTDIPIVFAVVSDPVLTGVVANLRYPGGNVTGIGSGMNESMVKRIEIVKEIFPQARRVAWLTPWEPSDPQALWEVLRAELARSAERVGLALVEIRRHGKDGKAVVRELREAGVPAFIPYGHGRMGLNLQERSGVPALVASVEEVRSGNAFLALGQDADEDFPASVEMAARILRGARPADTPVRQVMRMRLEVNVTKARALGVELPPSILLRADAVHR